MFSSARGAVPPPSLGSVPTNAVPDFYESFARWLRSWTGSGTTADVSAAEPPVEWGSEDTELAGELWDKLSPRARAVFRVLQREPGKRFSAAWLGCAERDQCLHRGHRAFARCPLSP